MTTPFDFHCHLDPAYDYSAENPILDAEGGCPKQKTGALSSAGRLLCGVSTEDWPRVKTTAEAWHGTIPAFAVHPWHVQDTIGKHAESGWLATLEHFLDATPGSWMGEAGLDQRRQGIASREAQAAAFADQLRLAARLGKRINLHCVGSWSAWEDMLTALDTLYLAAMHGAPFIVHAFGGPYQFIEPLRERGAYFTVGPLAVRGNSRKIRERAALLPGERIILESDAFLTPGCDAVREIEETTVWLAQVRTIPVEELEAQINRNGLALLQA